MVGTEWSQCDAHREVQHIRKFREGVEDTGNDCKGDVGAQDPEECNAGKVAEELLLLD